MDKIFEFLMAVALDAAMLILVVTLAKKEKTIAHARLIAVTMGIGFILGVIGRCIDGVNLLLIPDALGAVLSYTAILLTVPAKKGESAEPVNAPTAEVNK